MLKNKPIKQCFFSLILAIGFISGNVFADIKNPLTDFQNQAYSQQNPNLEAEIVSQANTELVSNILKQFCLKTVESTECLHLEQIVYLLTQDDPSVQITQLVAVVEDELLVIARVDTSTGEYSRILQFDDDTNDHWQLVGVQTKSLELLVEAPVMQQSTGSKSVPWWYWWWADELTN